MSCLQGEGSSPIQVWRRLFTLAHPGTRAHLAPPCIRTRQTSKLNNTIPHHNTSHKDAHFNTTNHQAHTPDKKSAYLGVSEPRQLFVSHTSTRYAQIPRYGAHADPQAQVRHVLVCDIQSDQEAAQNGTFYTAKTSPDRQPAARTYVLRRVWLIFAGANLASTVTERARRLRAQYNVQAQHLRSRVEMRINRIPTALRKATMGDLLSKSLEPPKPRPTRPAFTARPPPVPAKDGASPKPIVRKTVTKSAVAPIPASRGMKRLTYICPILPLAWETDPLTRSVVTTLTATRRTRMTQSTILRRESAPTPQLRRASRYSQTRSYHPHRQMVVSYHAIDPCPQPSPCLVGPCRLSSLLPQNLQRTFFRIWSRKPRESAVPQVEKGPCLQHQAQINQPPRRHQHLREGARPLCRVARPDHPAQHAAGGRSVLAASRARGARQLW